MGLYDTIEVWGTCPYSNLKSAISCQTKDLGMKMYCYKALSEFDIPKNNFSRWNVKFRNNIHVFRKFPLDKSAKVWKSQRERTLASATVHKDYKKLKFVDVTCECYCRQCLVYNNKEIGKKRYFNGKIKIEKGKLTGEVIEVEKK